MSTIAKQNKRTAWAIGILMALVILPFTMSAIMKITFSPQVVEGFTRLGIPREAILPIGIIELLCLAIYLVPRTAVLGMLLLTGYLGGAVLANIIGRTDFIHALVIGLLVWAGALLRVPELRALVPFRESSLRRAEMPSDTQTSYETA